VNSLQLAVLSLGHVRDADIRTELILFCIRNGNVTEVMPFNSALGTPLRTRSICPVRIKELKGSTYWITQTPFSVALLGALVTQEVVGTLSVV